LESRPSGSSLCATIKRESLPYLRRDEMEQFLDAATKLLSEEFGFVLTERNDQKIKGDERLQTSIERISRRCSG
jgi:hypothetical protein